MPELKPLRDQSPLFGVMDRPAVLGTDTLARISDVDLAIGGERAAEQFRGPIEVARPGTMIEA